MSWTGYGLTTTDARTGKRIAANVHVVDSTGAIYEIATMTPVPGADEGFARIGLATGPGTVTITAIGYEPLTFTTDLPGAPNQNHALTPVTPPLPSRDDMLNVAGNFCNVLDSRGVCIFSAFLPQAETEGLYDDWMAKLVAAGSTHVVVSPECAYNAYMTPFDWRGQPERFAALVLKIANTVGANGKAITPILFMDNGDPNPLPRLRQYWPGLFAALRANGVLSRCIVVPAWEPVIGGYTSYDMSQSMLLLHDLAPEAIMAWHGSPTRWVGSSNPVEPDDPWQGAEKDFYKSHGGEFIDLVLYQAQADAVVFPNCDASQANCWLNRWMDGVLRVGGGLNGWRVIPLCLAEGPAYLAIRGHATPEEARVWATAGRDEARTAGVTVSFMNGLPL